MNVAVVGTSEQGVRSVFRQLAALQRQKSP